MSWLWLLSVPVALACERCLDPDFRRRLRARARARRIARARRQRVGLRAVGDLAGADAEVRMLEAGLASIRKRWEDNVKGGWMALADADEKDMRAVQRRLEGARARQSSGSGSD